MPTPRRSASKSHRRRFGPGRTALMQTQTARGHQPFNIWYHYSARLGRDVILKSDAELDHFCWLEGDPDVVEYELEPEPFLVAIGTDIRSTRFDARVRLRTARPQLREVKESDAALDLREQRQREAQVQAAHAAGFDYVRITRRELDEHRQLITNWRRALSFIAACRELVLDSFSEEIKTRMVKWQTTNLEALLEGTDPALRAIYLGALFRSLQDGWLRSNLDTRPLCAETKLWLSENSHAQ